MIVIMLEIIMLLLLLFIILGRGIRGAAVGGHGRGALFMSYWITLHMLYYIIMLC